MRYTLTGKVLDYASAPCTTPDPTATFVNATGYGENTSGGHAVLTLADATPTYAWTSPGTVSAPIGQTTPFSATLVNDSALAVYVYRFDARATGVGVGFDAGPCTDVYLQPGEACVVTVNVTVGGETL